MGKFKVGDRVKVYDSNEIYKGIIINISSLTLVIQKDNNKSPNWLGYPHYKQCRRLKVKTKPPKI